MTHLSLTRRSELLTEACLLNDARDYPAIVHLLAPLGRAALLEEPELGYLLAQARYRLGRDTEALALVADLADVCARRGKDRLYARRLNLEGALLIEAGELTRAHELFLEVLGVATMLEDQRSIADATMNIGVVATLSSRWHEALSAYQRAISIFRNAGDEYLVAGCNSAIGLTYRYLGMYAEASEHYDASLIYYRTHGSEKDWVVSESQRAQLFAAIGDLRLAESTASYALARAQTLGNSRLEGEVLCVLGSIALADGSLYKARQFLRRALHRAKKTGARLLQAEVHEELTVLEWREGNFNAAELRREQAVDLYCSIGAEARVAMMADRLAHVVGPDVTPGS